MLRRLALVAGISVGAAAATLWWRHSPPPLACRCAADSEQTRGRAAPSSPRSHGLSTVVRAVESDAASSAAGKSLSSAVQESRRLVCGVMAEQGIPGAVVSVSVNGREVWSEGIGYADIENDVACSPHTVMRIASISKCLTAVAAMQLWEDGLLDLDAPVQSYVPEFPSKTHGGREVKMTSRQLLCHMAGIRHYIKAPEVGEKRGEFQNDEYFIRDHYDSVFDALKLFSSDDLVHAPGTNFHYTTHGWTLLSAVVEKVSGQPFLDYLHSHVLSPLGMTSTGPERHDPLTYHRARHYVWQSSGRLVNSPYVDNSYKWAGGGLISSAPDLVRLGSALLLCYQSNQQTSTPSVRRLLEQRKKSDDVTSDVSSSNGCGTSEKAPLLLQSETVAEMWREVVKNIYFSSNPQLSYGLGWVVRREGERVRGAGAREPFYVGHSGAAVGASSVLVIMPSESEGVEVESGGREEGEGGGGPRGVVVAVIFNLQEVKGVFSLGSRIAALFHHHTT